MCTDPNKQSDENADEYIRLAYQSALEDIRFFKRQQWIVTNYTILIYGAIIAVSRVVKSAGNEWLICTGIIALLSFLLIIQLHCSTQKARNRRNATKERIPQNLTNLLFGEPASRCVDFLDQYSVMGLLVTVILGGFYLSVRVLLSLNCS
jgi:uncharacterized membrane protein